MARKRRMPVLRRWQDYVESILIAVLLALVVRTFILSGYRVPTSTMAPALKPGDFVFAFKPPFGIKIPLTQKKIGVESPKRGDVVVFTFPDQPRVNYVKRVVGLPGDVVQIRDGKLSVSGNLYRYQSEDQSSIQDIPGYESLEVMREFTPDGDRHIVMRKGAARKDFGPILVPQGQVFLLGDNRDASDDSRYWGPVPLERVEGRVFFIWLSLDWSQKWGSRGWPSIRRERTWTRIR